MPRSSLSDTLSVLLPTPDQTSFLRACLHAGESGRTAWDTWRQRVGDPKTAFRDDAVGIKRLLPLLFTALQRSGAVVDPELLPYLRAAYISEELRSTTYRRVCHSVLSTLAAADIPLVALKGAALAETVYGDEVLRHSHDIDILLREEDFGRAAALLPPLGFVMAREDRRPGLQHLTLTHASGLPLEFHARLFRLPFHRAPLGDMRARSHGCVLTGVPARLLSPADNLLHVCGQAICCRNRESLQWVCDAWHIVTRHPDLNWEVFLDGAARSRLALPLSVLVAYLARKIDAPIPPSTVERLDVAAAQADAIEREAALLAARTGTRGTFRTLLRNTADWRARAVILKWMLLPSPRYLFSTGQLRSSWLLPIHYLWRPLRYLARRAWWSFKRQTQRARSPSATITPALRPRIPSP